MFTRDIKSGNNIYRYEVTSYWDREKKAPRQKVKYLGRVVKDEGGKEKITKKHFVVDSVEKSMPIGDLAAYFRIASNLELREVINNFCPKSGPEPGIPILILAFNQLTNRHSLSRVGDWVENTPLLEWFNADLKIAKDMLLGALDSLCKVENGEVVHYDWKLQEEIMKQWKDYYSVDNKRLYYDITKLRYYGSKCSLAEKGRKSKDINEREIGVALVTSQKNCFPVLCRPIPGAKHDNITVKDVVNALWNWEIKGAMLIMDRGMVSTHNLQHAVKEKGYDLLLGCPETSIDVLKELSRWDDDDLMKPKNVFERGENKFVYLKGSEGRMLGLDGKYIIVLDPIRQAEERTERNWMLKEINSPETSEKRKKELREGLGEISSINDPENSDMGKLHSDDLVKKRDGRFLLFSTKKTIREVDAFRWYFQKDEIEKAFRSLNNEVNLVPIRYRNPQRIEAYLTVNFIAYLLLAVIQYKLKSRREKMSVSKVIYEARKITQIRFLSKGKKRSTIVQPTHLQQKLIDLLDIRNLLPET
jgi:transposase